MAKESLELIKNAELSAKQSILDAQNKCDKIIKTAMSDKKILFANLEEEIIQDEKKCIVNANSKGEEIIKKVQSQTSDQLRKLNKSYEDKKDDAIKGILEIIAS